jgi:hypothetical protein
VRTELAGDESKPVALRSVFFRRRRLRIEGVAFLSSQLVVSALSLSPRDVSPIQNCFAVALPDSSVQVGGYEEKSF